MITNRVQINLSFYRSSIKFTTAELIPGIRKSQKGKWHTNYTDIAPAPTLRGIYTDQWKSVESVFKILYWRCNKIDK